MNKDFYILKGELTKAISGKYDTQTGEFVSTSDVNQYCTSIRLTDLRPANRPNIDVLTILAPDVNFVSANIFYYGKDSKYLGFTNVDIEELNSGNLSDLLSQQGLDKAYQIAIDFKLDLTDLELKQMTQSEIDAMLTHVWFYTGFKLQEPHYSKLTKKFKKETNQMFFRESIDGTIKVFGYDFDFINSQKLETKYLLMILDKYKLVSLNSFVKTDCKLNTCKHSIELKLSAIDKYSKIIDKYDNTYDLIKLAPAITPLTLTKRLLYQFYIQGADSVTCYANGTYWEQDVNDTVDNKDELKNKYYFTENFTKQEINITADMFVDTAASIGFTGLFVRDESYSGYKWTATASGATLELIALTDEEKKLYKSNSRALGSVLNAATLKTETNTAGESADNVFWLKLTSPIAAAYYKSTVLLCTGYTAKKFDGVFGTDGNCIMKSSTPSVDGSYLQFDFVDALVDYIIWARILADVDTAIEPSTGVTKTLYDLPKDDFVTERVNYRKCIGLTGINIKQSSYTVQHPTKYGRNDYNNYFSNNFVNSTTKTSHMPIPISRSSWANTAIWAIIPDTWDAFEAQFRKTFTLKDAYSLADVIKALLHKINPLIKFEATSEYSRFLYEGDTDKPIIPFDGSRVGYVPFIAPKSNILKGNYDQAAQKAEITLEQIMNMLRDCFRCYWYIDDSYKLRIEHISYFMNGLSYETKAPYLNLTTKYDKFNNKAVLYAQEEQSYTKDDLVSRYEFSCADDQTDTFDDIAIDVNSVYTQQDKTEDVNLEVFSTDIDLMLYAPDKFSSDGFALMMANKDTGKVPIASVSSLRDDEYVYDYSVTPQNYLCSWLYLVRYYMLDMPAKSITYTRAPIADAYRVTGVKQFLQQDIQFITNNNLDMNGLIKTSVGNGIFDSVSVNIDTGMIDATLVFSPK